MGHDWWFYLVEESMKVDGFDKPRVVDNRGTNDVKCKFNSRFEEKAMTTHSSILD